MMMSCFYLQQCFSAVGLNCQMLVLSFSFESCFCTDYKNGNDKMFHRLGLVFVYKS